MNLNLLAGKLRRCIALKYYLLCLFLPLLFTLNLFAQAPQQEKTITLNYKQVTASALIKDIKQQTGYDFNFSPKDIDQAKIGQLNYTKASLSKVFKDLGQFGLNFQISGTTVSVNYQQLKSPNASAGQGPGTIKGRIVEFETSQPLPGASVYILELKRGSTSDNTGYYKFTGIPAGKYTLQVSYVSYSTEKVQIEIKAGKEEIYDVKMRGSNALSEVVISGTRKTRVPVSHTTEKQLVGELKAAQSVVSGISSEQISKSADRNAAEAIRRISGVTVRDDKFVVIRGMNERYNLTYLNNNIAPSTELYSRAFSLDLIPSRIIDRILVYKSPAPDLLGDMTGGAVKIFTKDAKNVKHFDIELQTGYKENTTFNKDFLTYQGGKYDFLGFDDGTRKLPSIVPGFGDFTKANISQKEYAKSFSNILAYGKKTALPTGQMTANYYNSFKLGSHNLSMLSSLSYKNEPTHLDVDRMQSTGTGLVKISAESQNTETAQISLLQNFTYHLRDSSTFQFKNFLLQQGQNATILRNVKNDQTFVDDKWQDNISQTSLDLRDIILSYTQRFLYSGNLAGSHFFGKNNHQQLEWNAGYTYSKLDIPDQRAIHLQNNIHDNRVNNVGDYEQNWVPVYRSQDPLADNNNSIDLGMVSRVWIRNIEKVYNGSADYTWKLKPWATFKAGTYQQWKERVVFRRAYTLNEGDLPGSGYPDPLNAGIGAGNPDMDFNLVFFHQQNLGQVWSEKYLRDNGTGLKVFDRTSGSDAYTATEQNNSGYTAISLLPFNGKLDIYGGIRVEYNRQKVAGALAPSRSAGGPGGVNYPVMADLKATSFLPSLNIGYRPTNSLVFRGAYGKTVNRPEFRELSPYSELDYLNNQNITGNSNLVSAKVNNYDLRLEWYPRANEKGESISIGGFYKDIDHPIERVISKELINKGAASISFLNADKATVKGTELDIRKNLDFIPLKFFRDLSIIANGAYIFSRAIKSAESAGNQSQIFNPKIDRQLQGQAPYSVNGGLYYENSGSGTKVAVIYNQVGPRIYAAAIGGDSQGGNQGSLIELTRKQFDVSITQRMVKSLQIKFSLQNLLDSPIQIAEDANFTYKYEKATIIPAVRGIDGAITTGASIQGDLLSTDYKPGRFFLLTFTYSF